MTCAGSAIDPDLSGPSDFFAPISYSTMGILIDLYELICALYLAA
jgi:hypothetical protein